MDEERQAGVTLGGSPRTMLLDGSPKAQIIQDDFVGSSKRMTELVRYRAQRHAGVDIAD
jgi:hypothetical protein